MYASIKILYLIIFFVCTCGCNNNKAITTNVNQRSTAQILDNRQTSNMINAGVDFFAEGNEPSNWSLQMNYDDTVRFNADDGLTVTFANNQLKKDITRERSVFNGQIQAGKVNITVLQKACIIPTKKEAYKKQVSFTFNNIVYTGCGKYLSNPALDGKWQLEKIDANLINTSDFNKVPFIEFNATKDKVNGNDGCNNFYATIEVQGNRIQFSGMISTQIGCSKKDISSILSTLISDKLVDYYFKENKLYFYLSDDSILVFKSMK
jgi:heat shock protein HslJ